MHPENCYLFCVDLSFCTSIYSFWMRLRLTAAEAFGHPVFYSVEQSQSVHSWRTPDSITKRCTGDDVAVTAICCWWLANAQNEACLLQGKDTRQIFQIEQCWEKNSSLVKWHPELGMASSWKPTQNNIVTAMPAVTVCLLAGQTFYLFYGFQTVLNFCFRILRGKENFL